MAEITLQGGIVHTSGCLPELGTGAPDFTLVKGDLSEVRLGDFKGRKLVLNIFPSVDTPTCAMSVRQFNQLAGRQADTVVLCVSKDLPFAAARFCGAEGLNRVVTASAFRTEAFGLDYGVQLVDGPLAGLLARAVLVVDPAGKIIYTELVPEIANEPNYDAALSALK